MLINKKVDQIVYLHTETELCSVANNKNRTRIFRTHIFKNWITECEDVFAQLFLSSHSRIKDKIQ